MIHRFVKALHRAFTLQVIAWAPFFIALGSGLVLGVVLLQGWLQEPRPRLDFVRSWSTAGLISGLVLGAMWLLLRPSSKFKSEAVSAYVIASYLGLALLFVPTFLLVWRTPYESLTWITYPFLNKQWLFALYWLAMATFLVFPHLARRLMDAGVQEPMPTRHAVRYPANAPKKKAAPAVPSDISHETLESAAENDGADRSGENASGRWRVAVKITLALLLAVYFAGPPWHLDRHHRAIDFHEQVHLGPLQAISKGYLPYVGPASTQYGPGSQLATYFFMKLTGHFDIVSFREANACFHFITLLVFCLVAFLWLDIWAALVVLLLGLAYSPLHFFTWNPDGTLGGFYGWANGFRYLGVLVVVPLLGMLVTAPRKSRFPGWPAIALGAVCGLFCWLAQENLSTTVAAGVLLLVLLWLTETASLENIGRVSLSVTLGFIAFWLPLLVYYSTQGAAGEFLRDYFLVPRLVAAGFQNTFWSSGPTDPQVNAFYFTAALIIAVGSLHAVRPRQGWPST